MTTRTVDNKGRLTLGKEFANQLMLIHEIEGGVMQIVPAEVVPAREAWLYRNPDAISAVMQGLKEAKARRFVEPPDLDADIRAIEAREKKRCSKQHGRRPRSKTTTR